MRTISTFMLLLLFLGATSIEPLTAQTVKNIFDPGTPITYLGIDFTQAKVFGEQVAPTEIRDSHFPAINNIVITQSQKFDFAGTFHRTSISNDLTQVNARNSNIPVQLIKTDNVSDFNHLGTSDIDKLVRSYDFSGKNGIGLLLVMEGMSKLVKSANIYVTFIDMSDKKVLLTERIEGNAGGFGFRNYWSKPVEEVLKKIKKKKYKEWQKKYSN